MDNEIKRLMNLYEYTLELLRVQLGILINENQLDRGYNPVEHIKTRIKTIESITKKLNKKGYEVNAHNIRKYVHDVVGIRIVCSFLSDVYDVVNLIKNGSQIKIISEKNYIINPKDTGYTSYHLIVSVPVCLNNTVENMEAEIQIRTLAMDFWASLDHKIQYKFSSTIPEEIKTEMYNCAVNIKNLDRKMLNLNEIMNKYKKQ